MENNAMSSPELDLFGEMVVIQRRVLNRRPRVKVEPQQSQLDFIDILELSDEELERLVQQDVITDEYIAWLREYLLTMTLRQLIHPQSSIETRLDALAWINSDAIAPFSFRVCCNDEGASHFDMRDEIMSIYEKYAPLPLSILELYQDEKNAMCGRKLDSMLEEAIDPSLDSRKRLKAMEWFFLVSDEELSFEHCCKMQGIDPAVIRSNLLN